MTEQDRNQPMVESFDDEDPIGEMKLPCPMKFGARTMALAGSGVGLGVVGVIGTALIWTPTTPPLFQL